jgi:hypothetical protein
MRRERVACRAQVQTFSGGGGGFMDAVVGLKAVRLLNLEYGREGLGSLAASW